MKCKKGYKQKGNRCIKKKIIFGNLSHKKSKNPFKMIGPWIGFILSLGIVFYPVLKGNFPSLSSDDYSFFQVITQGISLNSHGWEILLATLGFSMVVGFLIGWGVQALIRRMRK